MLTTPPFLYLAWISTGTSNSTPYRYPPPEWIEQKSREIANSNPQCLRVYDALERFPDISASGQCGSNSCSYTVLELGAPPSKSIPQIFFSGAVHGNERPGPLAVMEVVRLICDGVTGIDLKRVTIIAVPTPNALGFYQNVREDDGIDPNRDFPYDENPLTTLRSTTAKVIFSIFQSYGNIQSGITFHAGTQSITYPWGSYNHLYSIAPDNSALSDTAALMQSVSGKTGSSWTYPIGTMNDVVYPVNGGLEDWAYALGFESSPYCSNTSFSSSLIGPICNMTLPSSSIYLVETSHDKEPAESELGSSEQVWTDSEYIPIIPRLVRMSMKVIDLVYPSLQLVPMLFGNPDSPDMYVIATGCIEISTLHVGFIFQEPDQSGNFVLTQKKCSTTDSLTQATLVSVPVPIFENNTCVGVTISGTLDSSWSAGSPQLGYAKNRTLDLGTVSLPSSRGYCISVGKRPICVSQQHILIHPGLIRYKPTIEVDGVVVAQDVSSFVHEMHAGITVSASSVVRFRSSDQSIDVQSMVQDNSVPTSSPEPEPSSSTSTSLLFLLFLILLIPIGYVGYLWFHKRSKKSMYQPAAFASPRETA